MLRRQLPVWLMKVRSMTPGGSYLDVGCGRAESLSIAEALGFESNGLEIIPGLCDGKRVFQISDITALGDHHADIVSCLDVMEHLPEEKSADAVASLWRATNDYLLLSIAWFVDRFGDRVGHRLHINCKPAAWWDSVLREQCQMSIVVGREVNEHLQHGWWLLRRLVAR